MNDQLNAGMPPSSRMRTLVILELFAVVATFADVASAQSGPEKTTDMAVASEYRELVQQLDAEEFAVRTRAEKQLRDQGSKYVDLLRQDRRHASLQVRSRIQKLYADLIENEFLERITDFENSKSLESASRLPGWQRFSREIGSDKEARTAFALMIRAEPGIFLAYDQSIERARLAIQHRIGRHQMAQFAKMRVRQQYTGPEVGTLLTLLHLGADGNVLETGPIMELAYVRSWVRMRTFTAWTEQHKPLFDKLMHKWITARTGNGQLQIDRLYEALQFRVPAGFPLAKLALKARQQLTLAIEFVGRVGGREYASMLLPVLKDDATILRARRGKENIEVLARDMALGWLIHLTDQNPDTYHMPNLKKWIDQKNVSYPNAYSFQITTGKREEAFTRWQAWLKNNPLPEPTDRVRRLLEGTESRLRPAAPPLPAPAPINLQEVPAETVEQVGLEPVTPYDRQAMRDARAYLARKQWLEAATVLIELAGRDEPMWHRSSGAERYYIDMRAEAEQMLRDFPAEGLGEVRAHFDDVADTAYKAAAATSNTDNLERVARSFPFAPPGAKAEWRLAVLALDSTQYFTAGLRLEAFAARSPLARDFEPQLSLARALCWTQLDDADRATRILTELHEELLKPVEHPREAFNYPFDSAADAEAWISTLTAMRPKRPSGWLIHRGDPARLSVSPANRRASDADPDSDSATSIIPHVQGDILAPQSEHPRLEAIVREIESLRSEHSLGRTLASNVIVANNIAVFRTIDALQAVDRQGRKLWMVPHDGTLQELLSSRIRDYWPDNGSRIRSGLQERLFQGSRLGLISSDGESVFGVEVDDFAFDSDFQRLTPDDEGRLTLDLTTGRTNRLTAYDIQSGRFLWQRDATTESTSNGVQFLGAPLPIWGRLYVLVRADDEIRVQQLSPSTGETQRDWLLFTEPTPPMRGRLPAWMKTARGSDLTGSSPSFADGVIVARTPGNRILAFDLSAGLLKWSWQGAQTAPSRNQLIGVIAFNKRPESEKPKRDLWSDPGVVIAEQSVLVASPRTDQLCCLDLETGKLKWKTTRKDGLYIACVQDGRVIVVGRSGMRAYRLDDGTPAWSEDVVEWPGDSVTQGIGCFDGRQYCVPLSSMEVVAVDVATGHWTARSRVRNAPSMPGNLTSINGDIWSLGLRGLRRFDSVSNRADDAGNLSSKSPENTDLLADWGEALLNGGRVDEAARVLSGIVEIDKKPQYKRLLARVVRDGVPIDATLRDQLTKTLQLDARSPDERIVLQISLAESRRRQGDHDGALAALLSIPQQISSLSELEKKDSLTRKQSDGRTVRLDRWFQGRFDEWYAAADSDVQLRVDARLEESGADRPPEWWMTWFPFHALTHSIVTTNVERVGDDRPVNTEFVLRRGLSTLNEEQSRAGIAKLAKLLEYRAPARAARVWKILSTRLGEQICLDGKTGSQLFDELASDSPVHTHLKATQVWPRLAPETKSGPRHFDATILRGGIQRAEGVQQAFDEPVWVSKNAQLQDVILDAHGRKIATLPRPAKPTSSSILRYGFAGEARVCGPYVFVWDSMQLAAYEVSEQRGRRLWSMTIESSMSIAMQNIQRFRRNVIARRTTRSTRWKGLVVRPDFVAVQKGDELLVLDPHTGDVLWKKDNVPAGSDLTGTDHVLCSLHPGSKEVIVFNARDGSELNRFPTPEEDNWISLSGRRLTVLEPGKPNSLLRGIDLKTGKDAWTVDVGKEAKAAGINADRVGVLASDGRFRVIETTEGTELLNANINWNGELKEISILNRRGLLILGVEEANPPNAAPGVAVAISPFGMGTGDRIAGRLYAIDPQQGREVWTADLPGQTTAIALPSAIPLLIGNSRKIISEVVGARTTSRTKTSVTALSLSTGQMLHESTHTSSASSDFRLLPDQRRFELVTRTETVTFTFAKPAR